MTVKFPVYDIRKNVDGSWNVIEKSENITVPSSSPYVVRLEETPDSGSIVTVPTISGLIYNPNNT